MKLIPITTQFDNNAACRHQVNYCYLVTAFSGYESYDQFIYDLIRVNHMSETAAGA